MDLIPEPGRGLERRSDELAVRGFRFMNIFGKRILEFPSDFSLGTLYVGEEGSLKAEFFKYGKGIEIPQDLVQLPPVKQLKPQGEIVIQEKEKILLELGPETTANPSSLWDLPSDVFWGMQIQRNLSIEDLEYIGSLTDLQYLSLKELILDDTRLSLLTGLTRLRWLNLSIGDDSLNLFLSQLEGENLVFQDITEILEMNEGIAELLSQLSELEFLQLCGIMWLSEDVYDAIGRIQTLKC
ncbi:MAG: hypothetical protein E4G99_07590, partial [Anaerolineales bacterium]